MGAVGGTWFPCRFVGRESCRLLAAARVVARCWRKRRKPGPTAGRLRPTARLRLGAVAASRDASGALDGYWDPCESLLGEVNGQRLRFRPTAHLPASGTRQAQCHRSSPSSAPVRRSVRGGGWDCALGWLRPVEARTRVWSAWALVHGWRLGRPAPHRSSSGFGSLASGVAERYRTNSSERLRASARASWLARSRLFVRTAVSRVSNAVPRKSAAAPAPEATRSEADRCGHPLK